MTGSSWPARTARPSRRRRRRARPGRASSLREGVLVERDDAPDADDPQLLSRSAARRIRPRTVPSEARLPGDAPMPVPDGRGGRGPPDQPGGTRAAGQEIRAEDHVGHAAAGAPAPSPAMGTKRLRNRGSTMPGGASRLRWRQGAPPPYRGHTEGQCFGPAVCRSRQRRASSQAV